jgi:hypothetical protein
MNKIVISGIVTSVLLVACGRPASDVVHPAIDPVQKPITTEQIEKIMWIAPDGDEFVKLGMHDGMFHFWFCSDKECTNGNLFFTVGKYNIKGSNELCFTDITFWELPPPEFFIKNAIASTDGYGNTIYTTPDFCTFSTITSEGNLKAVVKGDTETKVLDFSNEGEYQ